jgi:hypothetical protein
MLSIAFFVGLLIALGLILEITVKAHWDAIVAALRGAPPPRAKAAPPARRRAPHARAAA